MWYVYFLKLSNNDVYVGVTGDLKVRFSSHQRGRVMSTRGARPVVLMSYVAANDERRARALEKYLESGSGKAFAKKRLLQ